MDLNEFYPSMAEVFESPILLFIIIYDLQHEPSDAILIIALF